MLTVNTKRGYDLQKLHQVLDNVFSPKMRSKNSSVVVKSKIMSGGEDKDLLVLSYIAVVNFGSENEKVVMKARFDDESMRYLASCLKLIKSEYTESADGDKLSLKEIGQDIIIDLIGQSPYNLRKTAYYRRTVTYELKK